MPAASRRLRTARARPGHRFGTQRAARPWETTIVAVQFDREQIRAALALDNPAVSSFLDLQTGVVVQITEGDTSPENQRVSEAVMESYGDRYRYIPGGNAAAGDADVAAWLENEGL
jgi:hypothetical protein